MTEAWTSRDWIEALARTRAWTLRLTSLAWGDEWSRAYHPDLSPVGWLFGQIAMGEAACAGVPVPDAWRETFDPEATPKSRRSELPSRASLESFAEGAHAQFVRRAASGELDPRLLTHLLRHEQNQAETIALALRLRPDEARRRSGIVLCVDVMGREYSSNRLETCLLDGLPATNAEWRAFMADRGTAAPSTWIAEGDGWRLRTFAGDLPMAWDHPVEGIDAHEAAAFAAWRGGRLPTESEWERAARAVTPERPWIAPEAYGTRPVGHGHDLVGQVWEWTSSASGEWRVLRGGSWASQRDVATAEARMVCPPSARFLAAGVRVARSL